VLSLIFAAAMAARVLWSGVIYPESSAVVFILLSAALAAFLCAGSFAPISRSRFSATGAFAIIFFLVLLLRSLSQAHPWQAVDTLLQFGGCTAAYFLSGYLCSDRRSRLILSSGILTGALLVSLFGLYQSYWGLGETRGLLGEALTRGGLSQAFLSRALSSAVSSTFFFPNALAGYLIVILPFCASVVLWKKRDALGATVWSLLAALAVASCGWAAFGDLYSKPGLFAALFIAVAALAAALSVAAGRKRGVLFRVLCLVFCILPLWTLSQTSSEGAWLSLAGCALLVPFILAGRWKTLLLILVILAVLAGTILYTGHFPQGLKDSLGARCDYWSAALKIWKGNPLWGSGVGSFAGLYPRFRSPVSEEGRMAHSAYLGLAAETGVAGAAAFLALWISCLASLTRPARRLEPFPLAVLFSVCVFLTHCLADVDLSVPGITFTIWALAGMAAGSELENSKPRKIRPWIGIPAAIFIVYAAVYYAAPRAMAEWHSRQAMESEAAGHSGNALERMKDAVALDKDNPALWDSMAGMFERAGDRDGALAAYREAASLGEDNAAYSFRLAAFYWRSSKDGADSINARAAIKELRKALELNPHDVDYRLLLAYWLQNAGERDQSIHEYRRALDLIKTLQTAPRRIRRHSPGEYGAMGRAVSARISELSKPADERKP